MTVSSDVLLLFPPQWSPYQPPLSLPSLSAWLKRAGYSVTSLDANIAFYDWLFGPSAIKILRRKLQEGPWEGNRLSGYNAILDSASDFRNDFDRLRRLNLNRAKVHNDLYVAYHYLAAKSLSAFTQVVSEICQDFLVSPYEFRIRGGNLNIDRLEKLVECPPPLLDGFVNDYVERIVASHRHRLIGISCIGQEQLYFTLLFGKALRRETRTPVVVGGTILARIFERGNLPQTWFERFFDVVVRNEGERPAEALLRNITESTALVSNVPGIVYKKRGAIVSSAPASPLRPAELPHPDFDDMPLDRYFSAEITLPVLSARGCYWGKCEFCHHGMVYGERYEAYAADQVLSTIRALAEKYRVRHFSFNDEAIPPSLARKIGKLLPDNRRSGWTFTGLIKFEKYFTRDDFNNLYRIGFRSLYVGLESASERVLALMKKNNTKQTMISNLEDATAAKIWMHCFMFFGFPGETKADAQETFDFVAAHAKSIGSIGVGTFALEHNAPISKHLSDFGVTLRPSRLDSVDVYYKYDVSEGINEERAAEWATLLNYEANKHPKLGAAGWIPREHLLCLLGKMTSDELVHYSSNIARDGGVPDGVTIREVISVLPSSLGLLTLNRLDLRVLRHRNAYADLFTTLYRGDYAISAIKEVLGDSFEYVRIDRLGMIGPQLAEVGAKDQNLGSSSDMGR